LLKGGGKGRSLSQRTLLSFVDMERELGKGGKGMGKKNWWGEAPLHCADQNAFHCVRIFSLLVRKKGKKREKGKKKRGSPLRRGGGGGRVGKGIRRRFPDAREFRTPPPTRRLSEEKEGTCEKKRKRRKMKKKASPRSSISIFLYDVLVMKAKEGKKRGKGTISKGKKRGGVRVSTGLSNPYIYRIGRKRGERKV